MIHRPIASSELLLIMFTTLDLLYNNNFFDSSRLVIFK